MQIKENDVIVFQGDSITDTERNKTPDDFGYGYVRMLGGYLLSKYADKHIKVYNRGVSGNRVYDLENRWQKDCIDLQPDILTILIGVNDTWHQYDSCNVLSPIDDYIKSYRNILDRAVKETKAKIILMEPFLIPEFPDYDKWRKDLYPRIEAVRALAKEYKTELVALDQTFLDLHAKYKSETGDISYYSADCVHPAIAGHGLIASEWLKVTKL